MTTALTQDEKAIKAYEKATHTAQVALEKLIEIHASYKDGTDLKYCSLCFKAWPCESFRTADAALTKMKGQLPQ